MASSDDPSAPRPQPPVGIDLGTTYSVVAYLDPSGRPTTLPNLAGDLLTPSAMAFEDETVIVGKEAVKGSTVTPEAFAEGFKRDMGRLTCHRPVNGQEVPPEVLSAFLLERLRDDAEERLGPIWQVVITVPAFFDERRRKATQDAGRLAGLEVLDIINEPTAAAVAFGYNTRRSASAGQEPGRPQRLLVYDLGGGTFDVTILEIDGDRFRTVATDGDVQLGGRDFDQRLVDHLAENFLAEHGLDPRSDPADVAQLRINAQEAKHALSERRKTTVVVSHHGIRMRQEVTREGFEDLVQDLLGRTESTTSLVLREAGLEWDQIDRVLLVGGSTRMPMVVEMLRELTGRPPDRSQSADEVVAHGAALYAAMLMARDKKPVPQAATIDLINVNSHSLGVVGLDPKTGEKINAVLIPKNTPLPCHKTKRFQTARANQPNVQVAVVEGESPRPEYCIALGQCVIRDLPPGLPKGTPVEVEFSYAANGRLSVAARITSVRQSAAVQIERKQSDKLDDLEAWRCKLLGIPETESDDDFEDLVPEDADRATLLKRLDELYIRLGARAVKLDVPLELEKSRHAAETAAETLHQAELHQARLATARRETTDPREIAQLDPQIPKANLAVQHAKTKSRFAHLVLGRDCVEANFTPLELERFLPDIRQLRRMLAE
ncbi:MAG: Hsp70 family protein [Pirellulales bacterium]|nr:Hsp70 family protein [Pirellulales bacterium]